MKRKVYLDGELGEKYGNSFTIEANSFQDVVKCLDCNFPDFREYLIDCEKKGIGFICEVGSQPIEQDEELLMKFGEGDMYISPQPAGSKGALKIVAAIFLVVLIIINPAMLPMIANGSLTTAGLMVAGLAVSLAIAGLAELMAPDPATDQGFTQDNSYLFQGSAQTIIEGDPVPVLYGQLRVPGKLISFDIENANGYRQNYGTGTYGSAQGTDAGGSAATSAALNLPAATTVNPQNPGQTSFIAAAKENYGLGTQFTQEAP